MAVPRALATARLALEPLAVSHADELWVVLRDARLYEYLDEDPPESAAANRERCERLTRGRSADGTQIWLNWVLREQASGECIGYVQATLPGEEESGPTRVGYVLAHHAWGRGLAREAVAALALHLAREWSVRLVEASVDLCNLRSIALLEALGFERAGVAGGDARYRLETGGGGT